MNTELKQKKKKSVKFVCLNEKSRIRNKSTMEKINE